MTDFTVWAGSKPSGLSAVSAGRRQDGLTFDVTSECQLTGIAFFVDTLANLNGNQYTASLYSTANGQTGTLLASQVASGIFTANAWNWIDMAGVTLEPGTHYVGCISSPDFLTFLHDYWADGDPGQGGVISGPIVVPDATHAVGGVQQGNSTSGFPGVFTAGGSWYGIDIKVTVASGIIANGAVHMKKMGIAGTSTEKTVATGAVHMKKMGIAGTSHEKAVATGAISMKKMGIAGTSTEKTVATGAISMKKMGIAGTSTEKVVVTGAISMKKMGIHGSDVIPQATNDPLFIFSPL